MLLHVLVPSPPRDFKQYCKVVVWNTPSDVQGKLKNYELQFQSDDGQIETTHLEPNVSFYETTTSQKESGVKIRVCKSCYRSCYLILLINYS